MKDTVIMLELNLYFDNDTNMQEISQQIGLEPTQSVNKANRRKSPFKDDNLEGYWQISTGYIKTYYFEEVSKALIGKITPYLNKIKYVLDTYDGSADFCIVPEFNKNKTPAICFDKDFLNVVNYLNTTIQIDMYVN